MENFMGVVYEKLLQQEPAQGIERPTFVRAETYRLLRGNVHVYPATAKAGAAPPSTSWPTDT